MADDQILAFPSLGRPGSGDQRLSPLKSALQKYVRRGEVAKAVAVAREMLTVPGGDVSLVRRLPVIAAEDVGPDWVVPCVTVQLGPGNATILPDQMEVLAIVASLAAAPKSKEAYWLADVCWEGRTKLPRDAETMTPGDLGLALFEGDYRVATGICIVTDEIGRLHGKGGLAVALHEYAETLPDYARQVVKSCLWRTARGGAGELFAAAVMTAIDRPEGPPIMERVTVYETRDRPRPFDWYTQDGHTRFGGSGCGMAAKRRGLKAEMVKELMFSHSSSLVWPDLTPEDRWRKEAQQLDAEAFGLEGHEHGRWMWDEIKADVRSSIEWVMRKEAERGGYV